MNKHQLKLLNEMKAVEIKDEKLLKLVESMQKIIELARKKLDLLNELKIAYGIEYSKKDYVLIIGDKIFESDKSISVYDYNNFIKSSELKIYKTKHKKQSEAKNE
jgi:hypothetical protein